MKPSLFRRAFLLFLAAVPAVSQQDQQPDQALEDRKLPNGKSQLDAILKAEREENIRDAGKLVEMAASLKSDLEKGDRNVLSMDTLKKTDEIQKLAKKIRDRLRH
ncbi:MAG TPA: hypothetical protein VMB03_29760 [Bryobacteraceae bacterium]|nr:hypothetical protein [Bryobacteraceae bacterium]